MAETWDKGVDVEHEGFWRRNMKWSRFVIRMKMGAIRVLQGVHEKDGAMPRTRLLAQEHWEDGRQDADSHLRLISF